MSHAKRQHSKHDKRLTEILKHEIKEEIPGIKTISKETQFWRNNQLVAEPDGLIWDGTTLYILEYKCTDRNIDKAYQQLNNAQKFIENDLGIYVPCKRIIKCG
jgi:hypothetical protein